MSASAIEWTALVVVVAGFGAALVSLVIALRRPSIPETDEDWWERQW